MWKNKNIEQEQLLVAVVGLSPAVLTETVFALCCAEQPRIPDRIVAITTTTGRDRLIQRLFQQDGWKDLVRELERVHQMDLAGKLKFGPVEDCIRVVPSLGRDRNLGDIRTESDNAAVAEFLMNTLRGPCEDGELQITASLAGGRKTMGALLYSVMSLLGRFSDRVIHVLVDDPWDRIPEFLFPGCPGEFVHPDTDELLSSASAKVSLVEVPLVPLRYVFKREIGRSTGNYLRLVEQLRYSTAELDTEPELEIQLQSGTIVASGIQFSLSASEFAFYGTLAQRAKDNLPPLEQYLDLESSVLAFIRKHKAPDAFSHWSHAAAEVRLDPKENFRRHASAIRSRLREAGLNDILIQRLVPQKGRISIDLSPEQITFIS